MHRAKDLSTRRSILRHAGNFRDIGRIAAQYDRVVERLAALPVTFIHGEFCASNVLIETGTDRLRVCPIDWEMSGIGPGLLDLAALVSGRWTEAQRHAMATAYFQALSDQTVVAPLQPEAFFSALDDCRLHLAIQWLGWSDGWTPPPDHEHDWLEEALTLAEKVGCV
jgi:thiamine kinase-like enzyme